jgi:hypothetical protein
MAHRYFNKGSPLWSSKQEHYTDLKEHFDKYFKGKSTKEIDEISPFCDLSVYEGVTLFD